MARLSSISPDDRLQLRLHGKGYFFDNARRKHGALMHEVLSRIRTRKDIPQSVERYHQEGVIDKEEAIALVARLEELLNLPEAASWYDGTGTCVERGRHPVRKRAVQASGPCNDYRKPCGRGRL